MPSSDPYTFSALGAPWVVQSWLVSVAYGLTEAMSGINGVRLLSGLFAGAVAGLGWRLLRPADGLVPRLAVAALFVAIGSSSWAERPLMVGLIAFALTVLAAEGAFDPRWLLPLGWVWVNSHGSFPLGAVYLVVVLLGARLDGAGGAVEVRCLRWSLVGTLLGVIGPLGLRALTFPVELLSRQDLLSNVIEWKAPAFDDVGQRAFLVQVVVAVVLLARRPTYRAALVTGVFLAAALLGSRNVAVASIALLPGMAAALAGVGSLASATRSRRTPLLVLGIVATATLLVALRLQGPPLRLTAYPMRALAYLEEHEVDTREHHLAGPEVVGNLLTFIYGPDGRVFYDDRFDMYPVEASEAALAVREAPPDVFARLAPFDIELVVVPRTEPMALVLSREPSWRVLYADERWVLTCRRGVDLGGTAAAC